MSTEKIINSTIRTNLLNNEGFLYAHLVKFERPFGKKSDGTFDTGANRYAYYTDGSHDITYDDGSGSQVYKANRVLSVGNYSETTQARASAMSLTLAGEDLKPSISLAGSISTSGVFTPTSATYEGYPLDFVERGFKEGDKVTFTHDSTTVLTYIITSFTTNNTVLNLALTGSDSIDSDFPDSDLSETFTIQQDSEELTAPLLERGITVSGTSAASPNFINRSVMIYKVFIDQDTGLLWGNSGITVFKGVIQNVSIKEAATSVKVTWGLTSHWGDWNQVGGRLTTDELHRNLQPDGTPAKVQPIRNEYAYDFGFLHAETSLSAIANYTTQETRTKMKKKRSGGVAGFFGRKYYLQEEYQIDLQNEVDLNIHLQGKYLPVVYGVQRVSGNPVFADTLNNNSQKVYTADAICEGEVYGLLNIYIDDIPLICTDDNDYDVRGIGGSDTDNTQLQCFGRMSHGETLKGSEAVYGEVSGSDAVINIGAAYGTVEHYVQTSVNQHLGTQSTVDIGVLQSGNIGVQHRKSWSIENPHNIKSAFYQGRPNQLASHMLLSPTILSDKIESITTTHRGHSYSEAPTVVITPPALGVGNTNANDVVGKLATATAVLTNDDDGVLTKLGKITVTDPGAGYTSTETVGVSFTGGGTGRFGKAVADRGGYKRQVEYYTGSAPYWGSNARLLDTAYAAVNYNINADETTIPEIEYVVKGSVLECYNYDNTYIPDEVLGSANNHAQFLVADLVTVEYSTDGSSWTTDTSGTQIGNKFKIMDKFNFATNRQQTHYKFRLDTTPSLGVTNGAPARTRIRLKNSSNQYWYMITWNHTLCTNQTFPDEYKTPVWSITATGQLVATFANDNDANAVGKGDNNSSYQFYNANWSDKVDLEHAVMAGTWSGNVLTFPTNWVGYVITPFNASGAQVKIRNGKLFDMSAVSAVANITSNKELLNTYSDVDPLLATQDNEYVGLGAMLKNTTTNEEREIQAFNTTTDVITVDTPFFTAPTNSHKFTITGRGADKRASTNSAIQTLDYLKNKRYGKGLDDSDLDINSFISSAQLCDTRSDIDIKFETIAGVQVDDVYELKVGGDSNSGAVVAQGTVAIGGVLQNNGSNTNGSLRFTNVINKFSKRYAQNGAYILGDLVYTRANRWYRASGSVTSTSELEPIHENGTTNGLTYITKSTAASGDLTLHKLSGTKPDGSDHSGPDKLVIYRKDANPVSYHLYDSDWVPYWRYYGWERNHQSEVTRHQTNFILDTGKSQFSNINSLLSHFNGILSYENGKYVLDVETQEDAPTISLNSNQENINPYYIENSDIIGNISLKDDSQKKGKNTIKSSVADPQNNWGSRSITFFNSDFLKADRDVIKTGNFPFTGITNYWNGRIGVEKELFQSRFSKEINFTIGAKGLLLKVGQVMAISYDSFGWSSKLFRINNLNFNANCTVSVKGTEYHDSIYEITKQQALGVAQNSAANFTISPLLAPTLTSVSRDKSGSTILTWTNGSDFTEVTDSTEIYASSDNNRSNSELIAVVDNAENYTYTTGTSGTNYYWVRHRRFASNPKRFLHSSYHPASKTGGTIGTSLSISSSATTIKLIPSTHVIDYSKVGTEDTTVSFTTQSINMEGTVFFEFLVNNAAPSGGAVNSQTSTFTLPQANEPAADGTPIQVTVKARSGATNGTLLAQDVVSIFSVQNGQNTVTGILTNESHTIAADKDGAVAGSSLGAGGGTFQVYYGNTLLKGNADSSDDIADNKIEFSVVSETGCDVSINANTGAYTLAAVSAPSGIAVFKCIIEGSVVGGVDNTDDVTLTKTYSIGKATTGATGEGDAGLNNIILSLYKLNNNSSTAPALPDGDGSNKTSTYTFSTKTLTETNSGAWDGWSPVKMATTADNGVRWVTMATASSNTNTDTVEYGEWAAAVVDGDTPNQIAKIDLYQRNNSATAPDRPAADLYYNFEVGALVASGTTNKLTNSSNELDDWKLEIPTSGDFVHHTSAVALANANATQDTIDGGASGDWSGVVKLTEPGSTGQANAIVYAYQRSGSTLTTKPGNVTVSLTGTTSGTITTPNTDSLANGWKKTIPTGTDPLYICAATAAGNGDSDDIPNSEWSAPVVLAQGQDAANNATVFLYKQNNSATTPTSVGSNNGKPAGDSTYYFVDVGSNDAGDLTFNTANGWSQTNPGVTSSNQYLWITQATAINTTTSDVIPQSEWADIKLFASYGAVGDPGTKTALVYAYKRSASDLTTINVASAGPGAVDVSLTSGLITTSSLANSWVKTPAAADGNPMYICAASAAGSSSSDNIGASEWSAPTKFVSDGSTGNSFAIVTVYKLSNYLAGVPSAPVTSGSSYNFSNSTFALGSTNTNNGWVVTPPDFSLGKMVYSSEEVFTGAAGSTANATGWTTPVYYNEMFDNSPRVYVRRSTAPGTPDTATRNPPTSNSGSVQWSVTIPSGSDDLYTSVGTYSYLNYTLSWSAPEKLTGDTGINSATIMLYKISSTDSAPAHPDTVLTWNFANKAFTDNASELDGWSVNSVPESDNSYVWNCSATAAANTPTDDIAVSEWTDPEKIGSPKAKRSATVFVYYGASGQTAARAKPSVGSTSYNFDTTAFSNLPTGWSAATATAPYTKMGVTITEASYGGSQTIVFDTPEFVSKYATSNPDDSYNEGNAQARNAISNPKGGDLFYDTDEFAMYIYNENA